MPKTASFWKWLEARPGRTAVMAEWRFAAAGTFSAVQPLLQPLKRQATAYPNPRPHGQPMKVVCHDDGTIVAIDGDDWENRLTLQDDDIVLYQLNLRTLRTMLCNTLDGVNIAKTPVNQAECVLQIGNWEPKKAAKFSVYLLLCTNRRSLRKNVLELQHRNRQTGAILITPTRTNWTDAIEASARAGKMLLAPICEIMTLQTGKFVETDAWEEYLQAFAQMIKLTLPSNYRNKNPTAKRASLMAMVEKAKNALVQHIISARDGVVANMDAGNGAQIVKHLTKTELGRLAGLKPYQVTRCFNADLQVHRLYEIANDPEQLLRYGK